LNDTAFECNHEPVVCPILDLCSTAICHETGRV
jgi:hypothetical protein